jgi:6-phosphofructokinase 1
MGGTVLHTSRSPEFKKEEGVRKAAETLALNNVDGLVVVGGDGSMHGALELSKQADALIVGVPATIDNDVFGTDETIGFDTAVNTAITEIDKIRDTASSHDRVFVVEVMGRTRGFLALTIGLTVGAEVILVPEVEYTLDQIIGTLETNASAGKKSGIIVAAEGIGDTRKLLKEIEEKAGVEVRLSVTGYAQRGGNPTARSRLLANLFGDKAVELLMNKQGSRMVALQKGEISSIKLEQVCNNEKTLDLNLMELANTLAT